MGRQLTVQNASITTAAVELKTLTISGKQVTLAVFRQLREEPLIAEDGTLNGTPWGYVNYHPDKCSDSNEHWHVVWQHGDELLRSRELKNPTPSYKGVTGAECDAVLIAWAMAFAAGNVDDVPEMTRLDGGAYAYWAEREVTCRGNVPGVVASAVDAAKNVARSASQVQYLMSLVEEDAAEEAQRPAPAPGELGIPPWKRSLQESARERLDEAKRRLVDAQESRDRAVKEALAELGGTTPNLHAARSVLDSAVNAELARRKRHVEVREEIAELPQLFIAV